ncbi:LemA family protein [candidate division KSB1 bacterium]|nr:LemA family protein [candidate division KSB1 bacterium]
MSKGLAIGLGCLGVLIIIVIAVGIFVYSTYNTVVGIDESVKEQWAQVQTVLQRRMDLIPNLVETVKGYAAHERETLEAVIQARANATKTQINAQDMAANPQLLEQFMKAQDGLSSALSRLMVVIEKYPDLKADQNFIRLQDELTNTENKIAQERRLYNIAVKEYNTKIRRMPVVLFAGMLGFDVRPTFEAPEEAQTAPKVDFN